MTLDPITEAISRFIGLFDLIVEEGRLRHDYLKFKSKKAPEDATDFSPGLSPQIQIGSPLEGFDPGLSYRPLPPPKKVVDAEPTYQHNPVAPTLVPVQLPVLPVETHDMLAPVATKMAVVFHDGPGSIAAVTIQSAYLADDDVLLDGLGTVFVPVADLHEALTGLEALAQELDGFDVPEIPEGMDWMGVVQGVLQQLDAPFQPPEALQGGPAPEIHQSRGENAQGRIVDGEQADEAPEWTDLLPEHLVPVFGKPETPKDDEGPAAQPSGPGSGASASDGETVIETTTGVGPGSTTETSRPTEHDFSRDFPGHEDSEAHPGNAVVAGGNAAINEVGAAVQWIDASVIVVQGDVAKLQAINQVNVLVEHDSFNGQPMVQESKGINIAEILATSARPDGGGGDGDGAPPDWQLFRLESSLYQVNWVKQFTYVTDFDRVEVTFSAQMSFLGLGKNEIVNAAALNEYGYLFDLITVSGNMIDATVISQKNVLFDSDSIDTGLHLAGAGGGAGGVSMADNLLYNKAAIEKTGIDSFAEMTKSFEAAAADMAAGRAGHLDSLAHDKLFAGQDMLRALQIDGDLVKLNIFEQENIIGDADQLRLDMQRMRDDFAAELKMVTGSNALVNIALLKDVGVDSTIMAGGKVYDDALIHQAEWFDTDALANGVKMAGLTNDAVAAFLRGDLARIEDAADSIRPTESHDQGHNLDVMQTMLA